MHHSAPHSEDLQSKVCVVYQALNNNISLSGINRIAGGLEIPAMSSGKYHYNMTKTFLMVNSFYEKEGWLPDDSRVQDIDVSFDKTWLTR